MPYIIDGNNLIGSSPDIKLDDPEARRKIFEFIKRYQESRKNNIILVFDGEPDVSLHGNINSSKFTIRYPNMGESADEVIRKIMNGYHQFQDVILVTSDRELKTFARNKGAKTVNSIEFYYELKRTYRHSGKKEEKMKRINTRLSDTEVDQWMKIFDQD